MKGLLVKLIVIYGLLVAPIGFSGQLIISDAHAAGKSKNRKPRIKKVEVGHFGSYEFRSIELQKGETADLMVFLASQGEMVEGYKISLVRERTRRVVKTVVSGSHGIVTFPNLRPDKYTIVLRRTARQRKTSSVRIGDFRLKKTSEYEGAYFDGPEEKKERRR